MCQYSEADQAFISRPMEPGGRIAVIGLGYVGLPLAVALARKFDTIGFDIDAGPHRRAREGHDRTREVDEAALRASPLKLTAERTGLRRAQTFTSSRCRRRSMTPTGRISAR